MNNNDYNLDRQQQRAKNSEKGGKKQLTSSLKNPTLTLRQLDKVPVGDRLRKEWNTGNKLAAKPTVPSPTLAQRRRQTFQRGHINCSTSFSLENILFEGLLSEGISDRNKQCRNKRRILSFEDLSAIKKELSESSNDAYDECYYGQPETSGVY